MFYPGIVYMYTVIVRCTARPATRSTSAVTSRTTVENGIVRRHVVVGRALLTYPTVVHTLDYYIVHYFNTDVVIIHFCWYYR